MSASSIHLKLDGIDGESTSDQHKDEIEVDGWNWGLSNVGAPVGGSGGASSVLKPVFSDLTFTHHVDRASPPLFMHCATGKPIKLATLYVARQGTGTQDYLTIKLRGVRVSSVTLADVESDAQPPVESVTLAFTKVEYAYKPQKPNGSLGPAVEFKFDVAANKVF
jgi:type VI secretion system secreted protein Hcp